MEFITFSLHWFLFNACLFVLIFFCLAAKLYYFSICFALFSVVILFEVMVSRWLN